MEETTKTELVPALYEQCLEVYGAMAERSQMQTFEVDNPEEILVYEGFLTNLITEELHYSNPYYTKVTRRLKEMDCIRQLKRGGSTSPSRWALLTPPNLETFKKAATKTPSTANWKVGIEQQIRDLSKRLSDAGL